MKLFTIEKIKSPLTNEERLEKYYLKMMLLNSLTIRNSDIKFALEE